jgi:hypothetical protein
MLNRPLSSLERQNFLGTMKISSINYYILESETLVSPCDLSIRAIEQCRNLVANFQSMTRQMKHAERQAKEAPSSWEKDLKELNDLLRFGQLTYRKRIKHHINGAFTEYQTNTANKSSDEAMTLSNQDAKILWDSHETTATNSEAQDLQDLFTMSKKGLRTLCRVLPKLEDTTPLPTNRH